MTTQKRRFLLIGPPACGKGTLAKLLLEAMDKKIPHISSGDLIRQEIESGGTLITAAEIAAMHKGQLLSDAKMALLIKKRLDKFDCADGFILDGFPRTLAQAATLGDILDVVIWFNVPDHVCRERSAGRKRQDDTQDSIDVRLASFKAHSLPLKEYYSQLGTRVVDVGYESKENLQRVLAAIGLAAIESVAPQRCKL